MQQHDPQELQTTAHIQGEGYSAHNRVPTVAKILADQNKSQDAKLSQSPTTTTAGQDEKKEMMEKATAHNGNPAKEFHTKGEREVFDPVTGSTVLIKDAELKDYQIDGATKAQTKAALDPSSSTTVKSPSSNKPDVPQDTYLTAPHPISPGNILLHNFPHPVEENSLASITSTLATYSYGVIGALTVIWTFVAFKNGLWAFFVRSTMIGGLALAVYVSHGIIGRKLEKELDRIRLNMGKERGETFSPPTPESVEWMNAFTKVVWPLINPEMFISVVDMIEDVMQASLSGIKVVDAVKIADFTIGKNALRIVSMRALPDQPHEKDYPKKNWIDQGDKEERKEEEAKQLEGEKIEGEAGVDNSQSGDYVNFEVSFAYFAPPGVKKLQGENISLIIEFFLGAYDWFRIPIPIWIAVESIVGTVRLRLQMVPEAPFVRNMTFTLMGTPHIEASAIPLMKGLPNVLDLPLISGFVQSSIKAAASAYCAPKSMTMNLAQMIGGDGIKKDTSALGVLAITLHYAENLSAQDSDGFSDPYVVLAFAKFGKPLFSTRIITKDLNPVWEQTAYLLVTAEEVAAKESLSVQLWDSDKRSADDLVGRIHVPLIDLMLSPNKVQNRTDKLMGFEDADEMSGTLSWSIAYYDKVKLNENLKKEVGIDHSLPKELQQRDELKVEVQAVDTAEESDVLRTPPDPKYPSGVLSIIIHHINNLECQNLNGASGKDREGQAGQDTDNAADQSGHAPSSYCEIIVNDDMIYKTRVKQYSTMPFFEAGTEQFIHDWQSTEVRVVVRDARLRELDPILGIINLPLRDILEHSSQVTRLFALQDGVGFGRVNISVLFKAVAIDLPPNLRGWDTGTICVTSDVRVEPAPNSSFDFKEKKLTLSTLEAKQKLPASSATVGSEGLLWTIDSHIRLPSYDRYSSALFFDYGGGVTIGPLGTKVEAFAALWLHELVDDEPKEVRLPIIVGKNLSTLRQNYINDQTNKTHEYEVVGYLIATVLLDSGLDEDHEQYAKTQTARHEFETYDRATGAAKSAENNSHANDDGVIDAEEKRAIAKSHKKALESRHRGAMQFQVVRTAKWSKQGIKDRLRNVKGKLVGGNHKEETVASEA